MLKLSYPMTAELNYVDLAQDAREAAPRWEFPHLLPFVLAQWALESGWGSSTLSRRYKNFAGMKWREALKEWAEPVSYTAHDGRTKYCAFKTNNDFINAFFARFDQIDLYEGWREAAAKGGEEFINHIGPTWVGVNEQHGREYVKKILTIKERYFAA